MICRFASLRSNEPRTDPTLAPTTVTSAGPSDWAAPSYRFSELVSNSRLNSAAKPAVVGVNRVTISLRASSTVTMPSTLSPAPSVGGGYRLSTSKSLLYTAVVVPPDDDSRLIGETPSGASALTVRDKVNRSVLSSQGQYGRSVGGIRGVDHRSRNGLVQETHENCVTKQRPQLSARKRESGRIVIRHYVETADRRSLRFRDR